MIAIGIACHPDTVSVIGHHQRVASRYDLAVRGDPEKVRRAKNIAEIDFDPVVLVTQDDEFVAVEKNVEIPRCLAVEP